MSTTTQQDGRINGERGPIRPPKIAPDVLNQSSLPESEKICRRTLVQLLELQEYRCALTGAELTPETAALDHINPISRGGTHGIANVQIISQHVNAAKGAMTNVEFVRMCMEVVAHCTRDR